MLVGSRELQLKVVTSPEVAEETTRTVAERIAAHARQTPDRLAVADEHGSLTFAELDRRANHWAAEIVRTAVKPGQCVGLCLDRSIDFVVGALAALKSGAAYLPMDSNVPAERAAQMLSDSGAPLVLTHRGKTSAWAAGAWQVLEIDRPTDTPTDAIQAPPNPESLAYVVYTSGSTGEPKGVEITQGNLSNLVEWHGRAFEITSADRASQVAGLGFDATTWEIWPHLAAGASVHFADEVTRRSPQALRDWLVARQITIAFVPTVLAEQLLHAEWPADVALRKLLTGADVLHRRPIEGLPFDVVNNYGPSECTVVATSGVIAPDANATTAPSIGRPINNATVLLLDDNLQPVAEGEPGELCIAGALVGRGYRNRPQLTAAKFVDYRPQNGAAMRIYRTGDRARWLPNGELAFLGRLDDQIKIRGYRIEPGEIVANLDRYPGIDASAVTAIEGEAGLQLVAYLVTNSCQRFAATDLRAFLATRLPDYMIPAQFVLLTSLPLTPNGKLHKAALPRPSVDNLLVEDKTTTATADDNNSLADRVAALVASLLEVPSVGVNDNFFLLGGHSMLAAQLVARIGDLFGVKLTLRKLFSAPTAAALAVEIASLQEKSRV